MFGGKEAVLSSAAPGSSLALTAFYRGKVSVSRVIAPLRAAYGVTQFIHHPSLSAVSKGTI